MEEIAPQKYIGATPRKSDAAKNTHVMTKKIKAAAPVKEVPPQKGAGEKQIQEKPPVNEKDQAQASLEKEVAVPFPFQEEKVLIYFNHNSNELPDQSFEKLDQIADYLLHSPEVSINIKGFTDSTGSYSYNISVSEFRANTIKTYLAGKGVDTARIKTFGRGPENPVATNKTEAGRRKNRRVEIGFITN